MACRAARLGAWGGAGGRTSFCFSNSIMIDWICGMFIFAFILPITFVTPFIACAICCVDCIVVSRSEIASMCDFILYIFLM